MRINQHVKRLLIWSIYILNSFLISSDLYLYDIGMLHEKQSYPVPEIRIDFQQLDEEFESGDTLKIRLWNNDDDNSDLNWKYAASEIEGSASKYFLKTHLKTNKVGNELFLIVTEKTGLIVYFREKARTLRSDSTKEKIDRDALLRIKGLEFSTLEKNEVDKHTLEYCKNSDSWKKLNNDEFIIGKTSLNSVSPKYLLRKLGETYNINIVIQTGEYPTIAKNETIKLYFSKPGLEWQPKPLELVGIQKNGEENRNIRFNTSIKKDTLILVPKDEIFPNTLYSIANIPVRCTLGIEQERDKLLLHMAANLTGNFSPITGLSRRVEFSESNNTTSLINPKIELVNGKQNFFLSDTNSFQLGFKFKDELPLFSDSLNRVYISIPDNVDLAWSDKINNGSRREIKSINGKTIILSYTCNNLDCKTEGISIKRPVGSIAPFNLEYSIPNLYQSAADTIKGHISFSNPLMSMEKVKYVNVYSDKASLKKIKLIEDPVFSSIPENSTIVIKIPAPGFQFDNNESNLARIEYPVEKLELINARANTHETAISFRLLDRLLPRQELFISGIPISEYNDIENNGLIYSIDSDIISRDSKTIRILDFEVSMDDDVEIIQQIKKESILTELPPIDISIQGDGPTLKKNEIIIFKLPNVVGKWSGRSNVSITNNSNLSLLNINDRIVKFGIKNDIYNNFNATISGLSIITAKGEFLEQKLKIYLESDSSFSTELNQSIYQSYPHIYSVDQQRFFLDDTSWGLYTLRINTRSLKKVFIPGNSISIGFNNTGIKWDTSIPFESLQFNEAANAVFSPDLEYKNGLCNFTLKDTISSESILEITGLKILPIRNLNNNNFKLKLSLDKGKTYCALDNNPKIIRPSNSINEKIERQIQETTYALKRGKEWRIHLNADLRWDQGKNKRKNKIQKDIKNKARINVDERSIAPIFNFTDHSNLKLKVDHSFGSISQDLNISGKEGDKKIIGIAGFGLLKNKELLQGKDDIMQLYVPTPFGEKLIQNQPNKKYGWNLKILNDDNSKPLVITIDMPSIIDPEKQRPISRKKLVIYGNDDKLIRKPLIDDFPLTKASNPKKAKSAILNSVKYIHRLNDSGERKGTNWKTWYYLAWAKRNARDVDETLKLLEKLKIDLFDDLFDNKKLTKNTWEQDIEKAIQKGYDPDNFHKDYRYPDKLNIYSREKLRIAQAEMLIDDGKYLVADSLLLNILTVVSQKEYDDYIRSLECVARYNLAKVALRLNDIEYKTPKSSYPHKQLMKAKTVYKDYPFLEDERPALLDSIRHYREMVKNAFRKDHIPIKLPVESGTISNEPSRSTTIFSYNYDNNYTFSINGRKKGMGNGHTVRVTNLDDEDIDDYSSVNTKVNFNRKIRLSKGGEYAIKFSPDKESTYNMLVLFSITAIFAFLY